MTLKNRAKMKRRSYQCSITIVLLEESGWGFLCSLSWSCLGESCFGFLSTAAVLGFLGFFSGKSTTEGGADSSAERLAEDRVTLVVNDVVGGGGFFLLGAIWLWRGETFLSLLGDEKVRERKRWVLFCDMNYIWSVKWKTTKVLRVDNKERKKSSHTRHFASLFTALLNLNRRFRSPLVFSWTISTLHGECLN